MDHSKHHRLPPKDLTEEKLKGATVYGPGDEDLGTIDHLHGAGQGASAVVDVGGFLGLGAKPVALHISRLDVMTDELGVVHAKVDMTKDELKALPEHTES